MTKSSKKILVIAPYAFGYTTHIHSALSKFEDVDASILFLDRPKFQYRNRLHKLQNFFTKLFLGKNLKKTFVNERIVVDINKLGKQHIVFIIRPDLLDDVTLKHLKANCDQFIAYYYDSTRRFPRKIEIIPLFDSIYSYDKLDVSKYNLNFLTNFIFEQSTVDDISFQFFNISTYDYRFPLLEKLATYINERNWSYKFLVYNGSEMLSENVEIINSHKSITEVSDLIKDAKILVEIQRTEQIGLSFRVFEALGHRRKLVTTNKDIVNYDFYHPQNILVIDPQNIKIPKEFVNSPYLEIAPEILSKYKVENWVKPIFEI